jgi:hypothetical protein
VDWNRFAADVGRLYCPEAALNLGYQVSRHPAAILHLDALGLSPLADLSGVQPARRGAGELRRRGMTSPDPVTAPSTRPSGTRTRPEPRLRARNPGQAA